MDRRDGGFVVMYGQTEATARMSWLPHQHRVAGRGSVGQAIPGGHLSVEAGEVVYEGPNVMLGYATSRADLALGDVTGGRLRTGDLGYLRDGWLHITGRAARFAKIQGQRINLDDVERAATEVGPSAVVSAPDEHLVIFVEGDTDRFAPLRSRLATQLAIPVRAIQIRALERVPTGESGKTDHATLRRMVSHGS
jgi:acyl-CoA synthetase (AMP-forming)/AMP-acid ligase II